MTKRLEEARLALLAQKPPRAARARRRAASADGRAPRVVRAAAVMVFVGAGAAVSVAMSLAHAAG